MPTAGFQNQEGLSAKERTGDAEGGSVSSDLCACSWDQGAVPGETQRE